MFTVSNNLAFSFDSNYSQVSNKVQCFRLFKLLYYFNFRFFNLMQNVLCIIYLHNSVLVTDIYIFLSCTDLKHIL